MPTKALLRSAEVMHLVARRAAEFGVEIEGEARFNLQVAVARKDGIVAEIHKRIHGALAQNAEHIELLSGDAKFVSEHEIDTGERRLSFAKAIIGTGARRVSPPIPGLDTVEILNNRSVMQLDRLPESLIVIGGGYVGVEFAQMFARFGSRVTLLGRNPQLAPKEDPELSDLLAESLREEGIDVRTGAAVTAVRADGTTKVVTAQIGGEALEFRADSLLLAAGRIGNTNRLGLAAAGVEVGKRDFIAVDEHLTTSQPHIWAVGDVKGGMMFTHVAGYDGKIAALNAIKGADRSVDYRVVPRAVFSDPALASVGLTEAEAREGGFDVAVGSVPATGARAMTIGDRRGRLKAVVDKANGEILGFHILAPHGDDLLHEAVTAMYERGTIDRIGKSIHIHPTLSEMVKAAALAAR